MGLDSLRISNGMTVRRDPGGRLRARGAKLQRSGTEFRTRQGGQGGGGGEEQCQFMGGGLQREKEWASPPGNKLSEFVSGRDTNGGGV